jgi:hypothetical protein
MIEDRLRDTLDRVAAGGPDEAGAYDRFLRRRARHARRVAAATALALAAVLATAVPLSRLAPDPTRPSRLVVTGQPGPGPWQAGPLVAVVAFQGFEADVPAGWEARGTWKDLELRPVAVEGRRLLARPVQMDTGFLDSYYNPASNEVKYRANAAEGTELPRAAAPAPVGRQFRGSFPGGRGWFRADSRDGRWRSTQWDISWPYRCEPGVRCPALLTLRTLRVAFTVEDGAAAQAAGLAEHLLRSARPVTNAVAGQAHAPRQDCVDGRHLKLVRGTRTSVNPGTPTVVKFWWRARTTAPLVPCTLRGPLGVELVDGSGRRLDVQGNGLALTSVFNLPEASTLYRGPDGLWLELKWINWCGSGPIRLRWIGPPDPGRTVPIDPPRCTDASKPSRLAVERHDR